MPVEGQHDTVDAWLVRDGNSATVVLNNFVLPRHSIATETVSFTLKGISSVKSVTIQRIDLEHANAKRRWEQMGKPDYLNAATVAELHEASKLKTETLHVSEKDGQTVIVVDMPPQAVAAIRFEWN